MKFSCDIFESNLGGFEEMKIKTITKNKRNNRLPWTVLQDLPLLSSWKAGGFNL